MKAQQPVIVSRPVATFVGITSLDSLYSVQKFPSPDGKVRAKEHLTLAGGMAANAAAAFSILGGESHLITCLGNGPGPALVRADLETHGVHCHDAAIDGRYDLPSSAIIIDASSGTRTVISSPKPPFAPSLNAAEAARGGIVLIDGFFPALAEAAIERSRRDGAKVVWDADKWRDESYMRLASLVDIAICSADFYPPGCADANQVFDFFETRGVKSVAITRGHDTVIWRSAQGAGEIEVRSVPMADTLGAGDIFHGAYCYYHAMGHDFPDALRAAANVASLSCSFFGTREWKHHVSKAGNLA